MRRHRPLILTACALALAALAPASAQTTERIDTAAGSGIAGFAGDGGPATSAQLATPSDVAFVGGNATYLLADTANNRIRRVDDTGAITTVAGAGPGAGAAGAFAGDTLAATNPTTRLNQPRGVSPTADGGFLIADTGNNRIRKVSSTGVITTVAGNGTVSFGGDGDGATGAALNAPRDVAALPDGSFLIADTGNNRIRLVSTSGIITTVAGGGEGGDGGPASSAGLNAPSSVAPIIGGGYLIADTGNNLIRRVDATATITTVAGTGTPGAAGDGGPPRSAQLNAPQGVTITADGAVFIGDTGNHKVREIDTQGTISTLAGNGTPGFSGDGGLPTQAQLANPRGVAATNGVVWTADSSNNRIRRISNVTTTPVPTRNQRPSQTSPIGITPPKIGVSIVAGTVAGRVLIRTPGASDFTPLVGGANFPLGSELDTTQGTVALWYETNEDGTQAGVYASQGRFVTGQPRQRDQDQRPGQLSLSGKLANCPSTSHVATSARWRSARPVASAARKKRNGRALRVRAKGKVKTKGRYGSAIVRGTGWTTHDFCRGRKSGTLFRTFEGVISVRDFVHRRTVRVPAGKQYFA